MPCAVITSNCADKSETTVKIERAPLAANLLVESNAKPKPKATSSASASPSVIATLNKALVSSSDDIDMEKVNRVRTAIREGRLEINYERIADSLIQNMHEFVRTE